MSTTRTRRTEATDTSVIDTSQDSALSADTDQKSDIQASRDEGQLPVVSPPVDIYENDDELLVVAEVPGAGPDDLDVHIERRVLFIQATGSYESGQGELVACEFSPVRYRRAFALKTEIDTDEIRAELKDGLLKVHLPRAETARPRRIQVVEA